MLMMLPLYLNIHPHNVCLNRDERVYIFIYSEQMHVVVYGGNQCIHSLNVYRQPCNKVEAKSISSFKWSCRWAIWQMADRNKAPPTQWRQLRDGSKKESDRESVLCVWERETILTAGPCMSATLTFFIKNKNPLKYKERQLWCDYIKSS